MTITARLLDVDGPLGGRPVVPVLYLKLHFLVCVTPFRLGHILRHLFRVSFFHLLAVGRHWLLLLFFREDVGFYQVGDKWVVHELLSEFLVVDHHVRVILHLCILTLL